ncbi:MAG: glycosyltransferase family 9 protein [Alphaproteobacteria bacterium]
MAVKNLLFIGPTCLGDMVMASGILQHLLHNNPEARFTLACGRVPAMLFNGHPALQQVIILKKEPWKKHWLKLYWQCRSVDWDIIVDVRNSLVARLLPARQKLILSAKEQGVHAVEQISALLAKGQIYAPYLHIPPAAMNKAQQLLAGVPAGMPLILVAPAAGDKGKEWLPVNFAKTLEYLTAATGLLPHAYIGMMGAESERAVCEAVMNALPAAPIIDLVGNNTPLEAAAIMARAQLFIGNDSGLSHVAAAMNTPTIVCAGAGVAWRSKPWGQHVCYVSPLNDDSSRRQNMARYDEEAAKAVMAQLSVDRVMEAAQKLLHQENRRT